MPAEAATRAAIGPPQLYLKFKPVLVDQLHRHRRRFAAADAQAGDAALLRRGASSAPSRVARMRAPLAPIGWPSAVAPPWTLILSCGMPRSRMAIMATQAKASLTSNRSTSSTLQPAFSSALSIAPTGAVVNLAGSCAWAAWATMRATGFRPEASATRLAGQDQGGGAVRDRGGVGGGDRAVLGEGGLAASGSCRASPLPGCSSLATTVVGPCGRAISTGDDLALEGAACDRAFWARRSDSMA